MLSRAARMRARSCAGARSRDFRAGPARTTPHFFFSAEFIEFDVVTALDRCLAAKDRAKLGRRRILYGNIAGREVALQGFGSNVGGFSPLFPCRPFHAPPQRGRKFNRV